MSALSPFREDVELAGSSETTAYDHEEALAEGESWLGAETSTVFAPEPEAEARHEDDYVGLADPEAEVTHPILALFPLPRAVLEALAGGLAPAAVRLAIGAGYKDVNQLTNIVFYFRHPELIGRKIQSDQRELAAEWISIRDGIVKPALQSAPAPAPPVVSGPPVVAPAPPAGRPAALSSSRLVWPDSTPEELAFMRAVYDRHAQRSRGDFVFDLPKNVLDQIEGHEARKDAAQAARALLAEARKALAVEHPRAQIGIISAYRPATRQFTIWQGRIARGKDKGSGFPYYYREAIAKGIVRAGDFSPDAAEKVAQYLGGYVASPGYSNHQDGLAFDFGVGEVGKGLGKLKAGSWFHRWLQAHANRFGFQPLATEAWHWTYHPPGGQSEAWASEVTSSAVRASRVEVPRIPLLSRHRGSPPDLILRWNDMPSVPEEIDVVVHLHGFWYAGMKLPKDIEPVSGLDLTPIEGAAGPGRSRPTLTVLPRAHDTGVRQKYKQKDGSYKYGYNVMTFPALVTKSGLTDLLRLSLDRFAAEVGGNAPRVARLILTAHSGGGKALLEILKYHDPHQVHVFDALYWPPGPLAEWARRHIRHDRAGTPSGALRVFYGRGTRQFSRQLLEAISPELDASVADRYRVEASTLGHFQIPRQHGWRVLVDAAADVPNARREPLGTRELEVLEEAEVEEWEEGEAFAEDDEAFDEPPPAAFEHEPYDESLAAESEPELWDELVFEAEPDDEASWTADEEAAPDEAELLEMFEHEEEEDLWEAPLEEAPVEEEWSADPMSHEDTAPTREAELKLIEWALHKGGSPGENLIVNLVFHRRHPELKGRALRASETALVREWQAIRDKQVRPYVRHSLQLKSLDPVLLATYLSQYEGDRRVPVDAQMRFLWEPPLLSMGRTLRDRVLWNWHSGGRPLTADRFFDLAYELTGNTGYAALLCHNVAKAFSKGGVAIHWKKVEGGEGVYTGSGKQWTARRIHRDGVLLRNATGPSIFYVLFSAKEFGTEDHGDWYHYFVAATMTAFGTIADRAAGVGGHGEREQGELEASADTDTILNERPNPVEVVERIAYPILLRDALGRLRHQLSDPVGAVTAGYSGWVLANVLSFLEGAFYGKSQQEVARESRIHLRGAIFGVERARGTLGPTWRWFVPKAGSVREIDLVTGFTLSTKTAEVLPASGAAPAAAVGAGTSGGRGHGR
jgi:LAS superfamily LD-carboxypeptidase LdcB